jgi:hypothetical protein
LFESDPKKIPPTFSPIGSIFLDLVVVGIYSIKYLLAQALNNQDIVGTIKSSEYIEVYELGSAFLQQYLMLTFIIFINVYKLI